MTTSDLDKHTQQVAQQFNRQAEAYASTKQAKDIEAMRKLTYLTDANDQTKSLDVACGPGRLTMAFAGRVQHATGIDATEALLDIAQKEAQDLGINNIEFRYGSALNMPFADNAFDIETCRAAYHHFARPGRVFAEMVRTTKTGGQILIADILGHDDTITAQAHDEIERLCDPSHTHCLSRSQFEALFKQHSVTVEKTYPGQASYELESWLLHGGPGADAEQRIKSLFETYAGEDKTGLKIRCENGQYLFTHQTIAYVLRKTA